MPPIQLSPFLHYLRNILKRLWYIGEKLWKLGIRQVSFLQIFFRRRLPLIVGLFVSESCGNCPSTLCDKADHLSHGPFDNVNCFRKFPMSCFGGRQRPQPLPLHHEEHYYRPDPQTPPSTQTVVPYSTTPIARDDMNMLTRNNSTCSSTTASSKNDCTNRDPPGLSKEILNLIGVTSDEFERYDRNFIKYV